MKNSNYDLLLNIKTQRNINSDQETKNYNRYEATDYDDLNLLFKNYQLKKNDCLVDFGSGMGRVAFFANYCFDCDVKGIEYNDKLFDQSLRNLLKYKEKFLVKIKQINFFYLNAVDYLIRPEDTVFYFFNPFSIGVFARVVNNILYSAEIADRDIDIILYYPDDEYISYLEEKTPFLKILDLAIPQRVNYDYRERFLIYRYSMRGSMDYLLSDEGIYEISISSISINHNFKKNK